MRPASHIPGVVQAVLRDLNWATNRDSCHNRPQVAAYPQSSDLSIPAQDLEPPMWM